MSLTPQKRSSASRSAAIFRRQAFASIGPVPFENVAADVGTAAVRRPSDDRLRLAAAAILGALVGALIAKFGPDLAQRSFTRLSFTSILPYFILMGLFWCEAALIRRFVPFFHRALRQESQSKNHSVPLDAMRGLLALGVFFTHALSFHYWLAGGTWNLPPSQFYSQLAVAPVAMFFIITGYLFWTKAQVKGLGPLGTYFRHRLRRLYPAYLFESALILLVALWLTDFRLHQSPLSLVRSLIPFLTFSLSNGPAFNNLSIAPRINAGVIWSLRVEWMFYAMLPLLALCARRWWKQVLLLAISTVLYVSLPFLRERFHNPPGAGTLMYFNAFLFSYFSVGMLASYLKVHAALGDWMRSRAAAAVGVLFLLCLYKIPAHEGPLEGFVLFVPFLLVVFGNSYFGVLTSRPVVLLGQVSYSIYLLHGIVLFVAGHLLGPTTAYATDPLAFWSWNALIGCVVVALAAFSYRWFEAPFTHSFGVARTELQVSTDVPALSTAHP